MHAAVCVDTSAAGRCVRGPRWRAAAHGGPWAAACRQYIRPVAFSCHVKVFQMSIFEKIPLTHSLEPVARAYSAFVPTPEGVRDVALSELGPLYGSDYYRVDFDAAVAVSAEDRLFTVRFWARELLPMRVGAHKMVFVGPPKGDALMGIMLDIYNADTDDGRWRCCLRAMALLFKHSRLAFKMLPPMVKGIMRVFDTLPSFVHVVGPRGRRALAHCEGTRNWFAFNRPLVRAMCWCVVRTLLAVASDESRELKRLRLIFHHECFALRKAFWLWRLNVLDCCRKPPGALSALRGIQAPP